LIGILSIVRYLVWLAMDGIFSFCCLCAFFMSRTPMGLFHSPVGCTSSSFVVLGTVDSTIFLFFFQMALHYSLFPPLPPSPPLRKVPCLFVCLPEGLFRFPQFVPFTGPAPLFKRHVMKIRLMGAYTFPVFPKRWWLFESI